MNPILFDILFIVGAFVCGIAVGYLFGFRDGSVEHTEKDKPLIIMVDR